MEALFIMKKGYRFLSAVAAAAVAASAMCFSVGAVSQEDNLLTNPGASKDGRIPIRSG